MTSGATRLSASATSSRGGGGAESQIDFPIVYCNARAGRASLDPAEEGDDLEPLFDVLRAHVPAPTVTKGAPLQALVTNLAASSYVGGLESARIHDGEIGAGQQACLVPRGRTIVPAK